MPKQPPIIEHFEKSDIDDHRLVAALSYIWILFLIPLFTQKQSKFAQFHAKQGLVLFIFEVFGSFVFWIPLIGWALFLAVFIAAIYGLIQALMGNAYELPFFGGIAKRMKL